MGISITGLGQKGVCFSHDEKQARGGTTTQKQLKDLIKSLSDRKTSVHTYAVRVLGGIGAPAVPELIKALGDSNQDVRRNATVALGLIGKEAAPAVPELIKVLSNSNEAVRRNAAWALGKIGKEAASAVPELIKALRFSPWNISGNASVALTEIGKEAATIVVPALTKALSNRNPSTRQYAALVLGGIGSEAASAVPALTKALDDSDPNVREYAAEALREIKKAMIK